MKPMFIVSCPIDTYSGYGARARDFVKALIELDKYDVKIEMSLDYPFEEELIKLALSADIIAILRLSPQTVSIIKLVRKFNFRAGTEFLKLKI